MSVLDSAAELEQVLRERFGLEQFRPGQREVIEAVLDRRDVLCVMPTGGGKSLCYQLPAVVLDGVTLVVSPLIALMKDQVDALSARGLRATLINSTLDLAEQRMRLLEVEAGRYDLVYVAPERFRSGRFVEAMARLRPALLAVDEAHCISEWGHDFRPDYTRLGLARRRLGMPPCIALTATATDLVRRDIAEQLDLREPRQFVTGFDRPNLSYAVLDARRDAEKLEAVAEVFERHPGSSIIYASSRKRCEMVGDYLNRELRRSAVVYHAGLTREDRQDAQERFMRGEAEVVVATNAFGMGVDKANIRSVIHFNLPGTLEAYYQEAGRAGRDGAPAHCVLLYAPGDRKLQQLFIENEYPPRETVYRVYDFLRQLDADPIELTQAEIKDAARIDLNESAVGSALKILENAGGIERFHPRENMAIVRVNLDPEEPGLLDRIGEQAHVQRVVALALEGLVNRRFGEPVYFHPDQFAQAIGLDRSALTRALRVIAEDLPLDYIPPFRGNAVRVLDPARRARDLEIDFSALEDRKRQEYDKLDLMIRYAEVRRCRRIYILNYFGDVDADPCGRCDNCLESGTTGPGPSSRSIDTPAGREIVLKVLSGIARAKGRYGKTAVAMMLCGSGSEKIAKSWLARLSTFGILGGSGFTQAEIVLLIDALAGAGFVDSEEIERFKPVVNLSEQGWKWLRTRGAQPIALDLPNDLATKLRQGGLTTVSPSRGLESGGAIDPRSVEIEGTSTETGEPLSSDPLWAKLKELRWRWAQEAGLKAYHIFTDAVLEALVRQRPGDVRSLASIKGIGPAKLERFGAAILEAIAGSNTTDRPVPRLSVRPASSEPLPQVASPTVSVSDPASVSYEEWTWHLLDRGFSLQEAAEIRGLDLSAIIRHAVLMAQHGRKVPPKSFLAPEVLDHWDAWLQEHGEGGPPPDRDAPAGLWALFLACRDCQE
ncbi:RecQ family ATP-dependent DNA helicase [soil metagenome]